MLGMSWSLPPRSGLPLNSSLTTSRLSRISLEWTPSSGNRHIVSVIQGRQHRLNWDTPWSQLGITLASIVVLLVHKDDLTHLI
jgi:hypothetical protein